jgi:hypothetical protein
MTGGLRAPAEGYNQNPSDGIEIPDWMSGVTTHTLRTLTGNESHARASPTLDWDTAELQLLLDPPAELSDNNHYVLQSAGNMTGLASSANSRADNNTLYPGSHGSNSEASHPDTGRWSTLASALATTSASSAPIPPSHAELDMPFPDRFSPSSVQVPSQEHQLRTNQTDGQWLQKLVEINVQLFNHANQAMNGTLPPTNNSSYTRATDASSSDAIQKSAGNSFDETLMLSLRFLAALRKLHGTSSRDLPIHTTGSPGPSLDAGTTLIIYSCYIRVLDLIIDRLSVIRGALNAATTAFSSRSSSAGSSLVSSSVPPLALPTLAACSCTLEDFPILRLRMTLELVEEILDVMSVLLLSVLRGASGGQQREDEQAMPWRPQSMMPEISQQALLAREETAYQIIRDIRREVKTKRRAMM